MHWLIFAGMLTFAMETGVSQATDAARARQCKIVKQQIKRVHSQMRAGYSARKGNQLAARLRKLQRRRARVCH